ncbi:uncharacterized protein FTOL_11216 [Fusarium torulosum]|uniref:Myb-like domain-containing protein n=1 Tax=Fusarium torulosum TaxID=33205 RepID=A0AAE8SMS6_9HYPO|nr:uncharacterized protein FTOL_11216 [Fusarium torulosum]
MPPKKSSGDDSSPTGLTDGELRFIKAVFDNMTQKPDADWDAVATALSLKDAKCAKERFRQMSVRHGWRGDAVSSAGARKPAAASGVAKKPRTPRKKPTKKTKEEDDVKDETKSEDKKVKVESADEDENESD